MTFTREEINEEPLSCISFHSYLYFTKLSKCEIEVHGWSIRRFSVICSSSSFWSLIVTTIQINSDSPGCINYPGWLSLSSSASHTTEHRMFYTRGEERTWRGQAQAGQRRHSLATSNGHKNVTWAKELWYHHTRLALWDWRKLVGSMLLPRRKGGVIRLQVTPAIRRPWSLRHTGL